MHWRGNCFKVPNGTFVLELAGLFRAAGEGSLMVKYIVKHAMEASKSCTPCFSCQSLPLSTILNENDK